MHLTKPKRQVKCIFRIKRHGEKTDEKVCQKVLKKEKILVSYKKSLVRIYEILFVCRHTLDNLTATLRICVNSRLALSAGVHTMRARICSAISCDMFARVVWLKPWGAAKPPIFALSFAART